MNSKSDTYTVARLLRLMAVFGAVATALGWLVFGRELAVQYAAAMSWTLANFWALGAVLTTITSKRPNWVYGTLAVHAKVFLITFGVYALVATNWLSPLPLLAGLLTLPVVLTLDAVVEILREPARDREEKRTQARCGGSC